MTDEQWAMVRGAMPVPTWLERGRGRPESYCHRQMMDAVFYLLDGGIKWRAMPADFPPWDRVYAFWRRFRDRGWITELHDRLRAQVREAAGRDPEPTAGIIDSQTVRSTPTVAGTTSGFDDGKRTVGRKRHLVCDVLGLLLAVLVTRRLDRDYERRCDSSEAMIYWSMVMLMTRWLARRPA